MRALGVDFGGTKVLACLVDRQGRVIARATRATGRGTAPDSAVRLVEALAAEITAAHGAFDAIGIGFPGLVDAANGVVRSSVMLEGWARVPLAERVARALAVPCTVDNDVNTAAVAEVHLRGEAPPGAMLFVAVGTGIGGAIAIDGRLFRGASGAAGEIGNTTVLAHGDRCWCGRRGCLNTVASGAAIERELGLAPGSLAEHAARDEPRFRAATRRAAEMLGIGIANAMNLLNPSLVVLGGGVARIEGFLETAEATARAEAFAEVAEACRFEAARAGYEAGAIGAALQSLG